MPRASSPPLPFITSLSPQVFVKSGLSPKGTYLPACINPKVSH